MITRLLLVSIFGFLSCAVSASDVVDDGLYLVSSEDGLLADNRREDRRGDRQEDRDEKQDCRQEEGRIGHDKRECKQEDRGEGEGDEKAEPEGEAEPQSNV
jgi:hypothetical protein